MSLLLSPFVSSVLFRCLSHDSFLRSFSWVQHDPWAPQPPVMDDLGPRRVLMELRFHASQHLVEHGLAGLFGSTICDRIRLIRVRFKKLRDHFQIEEERGWMPAFTFGTLAGNSFQAHLQICCGYLRPRYIPGIAGATRITTAVIEAAVAISFVPDGSCLIILHNCERRSHAGELFDFLARNSKPRLLIERTLFFF